MLKGFLRWGAREPEKSSCSLRYATSAYTSGGGIAIGKPGLRSLGSRRQRFWFGILGLIALSLPYASLITASVKAALNPPAVAVSVPELSLPVARFPALALPKVSAPAPAPARSAAANRTT